jgi:two-component system, OmpR family, sensor kinase
MERERGAGQDARHLRTLESLLALDAIGLDDAMMQAAQRIADVLGADKVDVFLHDGATDALVAVGTSDTPMGRRQRELGLDRLPLAAGGRTVEVFRTGRSHLTGNLASDPAELPGLIHELGVRSIVAVPLDVAADRRGVLLVSSATPDFFTKRDRSFVETIARWVGLVGFRAAHVSCVVAQAAEEATQLATERAIEILTRRQRDVARLIGAGLTNEQIARELVITSGTAANYVEQILRRIGFASRVQIATWATEWRLYRRAEEAQGV